MKNYLIYDGLTKLNTEPFLVSLKLLSHLDVKYDIAKKQNNELGFHLQFINEDKYMKNFYATLIDAQEQNKSLIALDNSSYLGLLRANEHFNLKVDLLHVNTLINQNLQNKSFTHKFCEFNAGVYFGSDEICLKDDILQALNHTEIKIKNFQKQYQNDGFSIFDFDKQMAFNMAGNILFDAYDSGCDLLITHDIRSFYMFDFYQKNIQKQLKRPINMPIFTLSEIIYISLGFTQENFASFHKVVPNFI